jgi:transcription elongation factor Elf1
MNRCHFDITCPACGVSLTVVNSAHPTKSESTIVAWCEQCRNEYAVTVRLIALQGRRACRVEVPA